MAIGSASTLKAIRDRWLGRDLNAIFRARRSDSNHAAEVLNDTEARPGTPRPYCVFEQNPGSVRSRMSGKTIDEGQEIRNVRIQFRVHAQTKSVAAELAEAIMDAFDNAPLTLERGAHLLCQYQNDFAAREDDTGWRWLIDYLILVDVPTVLSPA